MKHHHRRALRSIFESHINPEKDEELYGIKLEFEGSVKKILKLMRDEDQHNNDAHPTENSEKEPLLQLIEDLHAQYQSLYGRYDNLTDKLRKHVDENKEMETSSSSSSSDSDNDIGKVKRKHQEASSNINHHLQAVNLETDDLKRKLQDTINEKESVHLEYLNALSKLKEAERLHGDDSNDEGLRLRQDHAVLDDLNRDKDNLIREKIMEDLKSKNDQLTFENETLKMELQGAQKTLGEENNVFSLKTCKDIQCAEMKIQGLMAESSHLKEMLFKREGELSVLEQGRDVYEREASSLIEGLKAQVTELELKLDSIYGKKQEMEEHFTIKTTEAQRLLDENLGLQAQILNLEKTSKDKGDQLSALQKKLGYTERFLFSRVEDLETQVTCLDKELERKSEHEQGLLDEMKILAIQVETLRLDKDFLSKEKSELERHLKNLNRSFDQVSKEKVELQSRVSGMEEELAGSIMKLTDSEKDLTTQIKFLEEDLAKKSANQQGLLKEMEGLTSQVKYLELEIDSQKNMGSKLEQQLKGQACENDGLREGNERLKARVFELDRALNEREDELLVLQKTSEDRVAQIMASMSQVNDLQAEVDSLRARNVDLEEKLLQKQNEASVEIEVLTDRATMLLQELKKLQNQKTELEVQYEKSREFWIQIETINRGLKNTSAEQQRMLKEAEGLWDQRNVLAEQLREKGNETDQLRAVNERLGRRLLEDEKLIKQREAEATNLKLELEESLAAFEFQQLVLAGKIADWDECLQEKEKIVVELTESYRHAELEVEHLIDDRELKDKRIAELTADATVKGEELRTVTENSHVIEAVLKLTTQKLRVTEQLLSEKEESYKAAEEAFRKERRELEGRTGMLSLAIASVEEARSRMITETSEKVKNALGGMDVLMKKVEEGFGQFENRICGIREMSRLGRGRLHSMAETEMALREKVGRLEREKEEGMVGLGEEKREAIRQLCVWIDYHRARCDGYRDALSKVVGRGR